MSFEITGAEIERRLTNQAPRTQFIHGVMDELTQAAVVYGKALTRLVPEGREKSLAVTALEESSMWAKKGIALNQGQIDSSAS